MSSLFYITEHSVIQLAVLAWVLAEGRKIKALEVAGSLFDVAIDLCRFAHGGLSCSFTNFTARHVSNVTIFFVMLLLGHLLVPRAD
eukprot:COSAG01_NODE_21214_length_912_cov_10.366544_2_plen_86_part_00